MAKLTDAEIDQLAEHWWQQHDKPLEPLVAPGVLVAYTALPDVGPGGIAAAAIREELREHGYSEGLRWW